MFAVLISILAGISVVVSRIINYNLSKRIGVMQSTFFNYVVGLLFSFICLFLSATPLYSPNINWHTIPFWAYLGGLTGILVVVLSTYMTSKMSSFYLTLFIFISQFFVGILIDYFNRSELSIGKVVGGFLVLMGLIYNLTLDKNLKVQETITDC